MFLIKIILLYPQIASGQTGHQAVHVLKVVAVDPKNLLEIKRYLKVMVDLVQVQMKNLIHVIHKTALQVSFFIPLYIILRNSCDYLYKYTE